MGKQKEIFKKTPGIIARKIAGEIIIIPAQKKAGEIECIYHLDNEVSVRIWDLIDGKRDIEKIKNTIFAEFEIKDCALIKDLKAFIAEFLKIGVLE